MKIAVRLENKKIGLLDNSSIDYQDANLFIGERITIQGTDEKGNHATFEGILKEVIA